MAQDPTIGGGRNARPPGESVGQTAPGLPDDSVGPGERTFSAQSDFDADLDAEGLAAKLRREAERFLRRGRGAEH